MLSGKFDSQSCLIDFLILLLVFLFCLVSPLLPPERNYLILPIPHHPPKGADSEILLDFPDSASRWQSLPFLAVCLFLFAKTVCFLL